MVFSGRNRGQCSDFVFHVKTVWHTMSKFELTIFADYHQFYIQDDDERFGDLSEAWTNEAVSSLLAVSDHVVGIGTVRNSEVSVILETCSHLPDLVPEEWDRINQATLVCDTGRFVVAGCTDYFPDAFRVKVEPGSYNVLVGYRNLETVSANDIKGGDSYHIFISRMKN